MGEPKEIREEYIGQVDLISWMTPIHLKTWEKPEFPSVSQNDCQTRNTEEIMDVKEQIWLTDVKYLRMST